MPMADGQHYVHEFYVAITKAVEAVNEVHIIF